MIILAESHAAQVSILIVNLDHLNDDLTKDPDDPSANTTTLSRL
jgi:hypothetical protein